MRVIYTIVNEKKKKLRCRREIKNIDSIDFCDDHILLFKRIDGVLTTIGFIYFSDVLSIENY